MMCHTSAMTSGFDIAVLRHQLSERMRQKAVKPTTLSLKVGKNPTLVKDLLEKTADVKLGTISKLANELDCDVLDLLAPEGVERIPLGPTLYLKGEVAAGNWVEAYEWPEDEWQTFTGRSDVNAQQQDRFGLRIVGDSMNELYPEGTIVECISTFGHTEIEPGKKVVVLRKRIDQTYEATVKQYVVIDDQKWLRPRSTNPAHQAINLETEDADIEETRVIAIVVASVRPE